MSAALKWTAVEAAGQIPLGMLTNAKIVAVNKTTIVIVGGLCGTRSNRVNVLKRDPATTDWSWKQLLMDKGDPFPAVCNHTIFAAKYSSTRRRNKLNKIEGRDVIFCYGGQEDSHDLSSASFILDIGAETPVWRKLFVSETPMGREGAASCILNGEIYVHGGRCPPINCGNGLQDDLWRLNIEKVDLDTPLAPLYNGGLGGAKWTEVMSAVRSRKPCPRYMHAVVSMDSEAPPVSRQKHERTHVFHPTGSGATLNSIIYLFGGCSEPVKRTKLGDLWTWQPGIGWRQVTTMGKKPAARCNHAMMFIPPDSLAIWGGSLDGDKFGDKFGDTVYILDLHCNYWTTPYVGGSAPTPRRDLACSDYSGGIFVCFGGTPVGSVELHAMAGPHEQQIHVLHDEEDAYLYEESNTDEKMMGKVQAYGVGTGDIDSMQALAGAEKELDRYREKLMDLKKLVAKAHQDLVTLKAQHRKEVLQNSQYDEVLSDFSYELKHLSNELGYLRQRNGVLFKIGDCEKDLHEGTRELCSAMKQAFALCEGLMMDRDEGIDALIRELFPDEFRQSESLDASRSAEEGEGRAKQKQEKGSKDKKNKKKEDNDDDDDVVPLSEGEIARRQKAAKDHTKAVQRVKDLMFMRNQREIQLNDRVMALKEELGVYDDRRCLEEATLPEEMRRPKTNLDHQLQSRMTDLSVNLEGRTDVLLDESQLGSPY